MTEVFHNERKVLQRMVLNNFEITESVQKTEIDLFSVNKFIGVLDKDK